VTEGGGDRGWWQQMVVATEGGGDMAQSLSLSTSVKKKKTYLSPNDAVASFGLTLCSSLPCRCPGTSCSFVVMCLARSLPWWWIQKVTGCGEKVGPVLSSPVWTHKYDQTNIQNTFSS
jgi:hypothetical protein